MIENLLERFRFLMLYMILFFFWYFIFIVIIISFKFRFFDIFLLKDENEIKYICYKNGLVEIIEC